MKSIFLFQSFFGILKRNFCLFYVILGYFQGVVYDSKCSENLKDLKGGKIT